MKQQHLLIAGIILLATACSKEGYYNYMPKAAGQDAVYESDPVSPPQSGDSFDEIKENPFVKVADEPQSSFSVDADGAAYAYMRRCITQGFLPQRNAVRIEEYLGDARHQRGNRPLSLECGAFPAKAGP